MNIKGAIFDLDGTLLDSMSIWDTIGERYLKGLGITPRDGLREDLRPLSLLQSAEYFRCEYNISDTTQKIMADINNMIEHFYNDVFLPKDGVLDLLIMLKQKQVKMCVATLTDRHLVEAALKRTEMYEYFEAIFTSTEVCAGKDKPDIFFKALSALETNIEETFVFEDTLLAIKTAKKAGFPVVAVYDSSAEKFQGEIKQFADIYINSFDEMKGFV